MTGADYRAIRAKMGLTQAELADALGVNVHTVARRERGEVQVTREMELALKQLIAARKTTRRS